jgi:hypothetical protein
MTDEEIEKEFEEWWDTPISADAELTSPYDLAKRAYFARAKKDQKKMKGMIKLTPEVMKKLGMTFT